MLKTVRNKIQAHSEQDNIESSEKPSMDTDVGSKTCIARPRPYGLEQEKCEHAEQANMDTQGARQV